MSSPAPSASNSGSPRGFAVTVGYAGDHAVLRVRRDVAVPGTGELTAIVDAVIASGYRSVVLDLAELDLLDHAGQRVIAYATSRLIASGGELTIRSPTATVTRSLDITWLDGHVRLALPSSARPHLGSEQSGAARTAGTSSHGLVHTLKEVTAIPSNDDVVDGALRLVVNLAKTTVGGADGVSVSLRRHGRLATVAASDQTISDMDANQYATGEGPCVDASVKGRWFHAEALETETRWPSFTPRARALGINAILSSPLLVTDRPVGALNIYSRTATAFAPKDQELAAVFAAETSTVLTNAGVEVIDDAVSTHPRHLGPGFGPGPGPRG